MKHVLVINRYDDELSDYKKYINHNDADVSYITLKGRTKYIDPNVSSEVIEVDSLDADTVLSKVNSIHLRQPIDFVIAFSEYDLDAAARIRSELSISGAKIEDNLLCRNKTSMKEALIGSSVRYPNYCHVFSRQDVEKFCRNSSFPLILKPQVGAASDGVVKIESFSDIPDIDDFSGYEIEEYIEGDIYHVDAILCKNGMPYFKVSKYINTCLDFRNGLPLGSVTIDCPNFISKAKNFTEAVCKRLNLKNQAIHLELIESNGELVFLEIGGRVGGGEIPFVALYNENIDLYEMWTQAALGESIQPVETKVTGFLMMPNPYLSGFEFNFNEELNHPLITFKSIKEKGDNNGFSYEDIPARLHFMGASQDEVEFAIRNCMSILVDSILPV